MDTNDPKARPAIVRFERIAKENKAKSLEQGRYVADDVDMALVTPQGTRDVFKQEVKDWLARNRHSVQEDRLPREWAEHYEKQYAAWKDGQELPLNGTPIRGWGMISPAQQEMIIRCNLPTVEDLAQAGGDAIRRLHIGGLELKNKAVAWLAANDDKGAVTQRIAALETKTNNLVDESNAKDEIIKKLSAKLGIPIEVVQSTGLPPAKLTNTPLVNGDKNSVVGTVGEPNSAATEKARYIAKFGKPPHHRMKPETIAAAVA